MNTTARIETTGERDKIHVSQETADLLIRSGKEHWLAQRENKVEAKGKGRSPTTTETLSDGRAASRTVTNLLVVDTVNHGGTNRDGVICEVFPGPQQQHCYWDGDSFA